MRWREANKDCMQTRSEPGTRPSLDSCGYQQSIYIWVARPCLIKTTIPSRIQTPSLHSCSTCSRMFYVHSCSTFSSITGSRMFIQSALNSVRCRMCFTALRRRRECTCIIFCWLTKSVLLGIAIALTWAPANGCSLPHPFGNSNAQVMSLL